MEAMLNMEVMWQFPCCWGTADGCHIPIQCPPGGQEACKEYHNFKIFFSIIMMTIVDAKDGFFWVSVGFFGIFQSTKLWQDISENNIIPSVAKSINGTKFFPITGYEIATS